MNGPFVRPAPRAAINTRRTTRLAGTIASMRPLTHDTFELIVTAAAPETLLQARAGQFATLRVRGVERPRPYSFARDPRSEPRGRYTFFIRLVPGGELSAWLAARDRTGEAVELTGPLGTFTLDDGNHPMLLLAGGSGMSAVKALAEEACRRQLPRDCLFLYGARTRADLYARAELEALTTQWRRGYRFRFVEVLSEEPAGSAWTGVRGFVTDALRSHFLAREPWMQAPFKAWLCGPPPMIEAGEALLRAHGVPAASIYVDVFADMRSPVPALDNRKCALCDECLMVSPVEGCIVETSAVSHAGDSNGSRAYAPIIPSVTAGLYYSSLAIDAARCIRCYACVKACPHGAISV